MAKWFDPIEQDQHLGKIKCDNIRALAIKLGGGAIPIEEVEKAIRKAFDEGLFLQGDVLSLVIQELAEDWLDSKIKISMVRIEKLVQKVCPAETERVFNWLEKQVDTGMEISMENKGTVLRTMAQANLGVPPARGYRILTIYLRSKEDKQ